MERALDEFDIAGPGVHTTIPFVRRVLDDAGFRKGRYTTGLVDRLLAAPAPADGHSRFATAPGADPDATHRRTR